MMDVLSPLDFTALAFFVFAWQFLEVLLRLTAWKRPSLSDLMARRRREWMLVAAERDLRMIDTAILNGLQQGAAFFGSTTILAIGGCFALFGSTDQVLQIVSDLPIPTEVSRQIYEIKVFGLTVIFVYAFFKFGWSYRLFNYCSILVGAIPMVKDGSDEERKKAALLAADMNIISGRHFTAGMRGIFFALAYLGWFLGPFALMGSTLCVVIVLLRRQFFSKARATLVETLTR